MRVVSLILCHSPHYGDICVLSVSHQTLSHPRASHMPFSSPGCSFLCPLLSPLNSSSGSQVEGPILRKSSPIFPTLNEAPLLPFAWCHASLSSSLDWNLHKDKNSLLVAGYPEPRYNQLHGCVCLHWLGLPERSCLNPDTSGDWKSETRVPPWLVPGENLQTLQMVAFPRFTLMGRE